MSDALRIYLHDHLAGSHFAIELLESLHDKYKDEALGTFALTISAEVKRDQNTLQSIVEKVGPAHLDLTEAAGWLAEKASRLKLRRDDPSGGIGTFEALETLALGIRGKLELASLAHYSHRGRESAGLRFRRAQRAGRAAIYGSGATAAGACPHRLFAQREIV